MNLTRTEYEERIKKEIFGNKKGDLIMASIPNNYEINVAKKRKTEDEYGVKWISVSERLPEESTVVLIWCPERKNIYCAYLEEKQWWIFGAYFQKVPLEVIAWQPLPQPYEPQESEGSIN